MLIYDFSDIGNKLLAIRKRAGLTQVEVAEAAGLSNRILQALSCFCFWKYECEQAGENL